MYLIYITLSFTCFYQHTFPLTLVARIYSEIIDEIVTTKTMAASPNNIWFDLKKQNELSLFAKFANFES